MSDWFWILLSAMAGCVHAPAPDNTTKVAIYAPNSNLARGARIDNAWICFSQDGQTQPYCAQVTGALAQKDPMTK